MQQRTIWGVMTVSVVGMLAVAGEACAGIRVLVAGDPSGGAAWTADVVAKVKAAGVFDSSAVVDTFDIGSSTPTLAQLKTYDAVLVFCDGGANDSTTLGNNMADYVDAGGNVVEMVFANYSSELAGRWESSAYSPINHTTGDSTAAATLGALTIKSHPIMSGVSAFAGGSIPWRSTATLNANANLIASWSTGEALVATRHDKAGHIAALNFFPVSSDQYSGGWTAAGDNGGKLMANALKFVADHKTDVLILGSPATAAWLDETKATLRAFGRVGGAIDTFNTSSGTPSLAMLKNYDSVLVFTDAGMANPTAVGNNLADYIDSGGGVVTAAFTGLSGDNVAGRFQSGGYSPVTLNGYNVGVGLTLGTVALPSHPIMSRVTSFNGGSSSFYCTVGVAPGATLVASWSNNVPLVVTRDDFAGRVATVNMYPPSSASRSDMWDRTTDGAAMLGNALKYAARRDNDVLILGEDGTAAGALENMAATIQGQPGVGAVKTYDYRSAIPSQSYLNRFDSVLVCGLNYPPADRDGMGNELANYVDAGGGVVLMYAANFGSPYGLGGRWESSGYTPLVVTGGDYSNADIGNKDLPGHPVVSRVHVLTGGNYLLRAMASLRGGSKMIAEYADGRPLAAERSTKAGRVVELNYYGGSSDFNSTWGWWSGGQGGLMMTNAMNYVARSDMSVLLLGTPSSGIASVADITDKLRRIGRIAGRIDSFDITVTTPVLGLVSAYDAVLTYDETSPNSPTALGDVVANYNDLGYGVVQSTFSNSTIYGLAGRWASQGYNPLAYTGLRYVNDTLGVVENPSSPVMTAVASFNNGSSGYSDSTAITPGSQKICDYTAGVPLAAEKKVSNRQVVGLNFLPGSSDVLGGAWVSSTDGALLISNALTYVSTTRPCPADFNNDGFVDIFDFNDFVTAFESGDPAADFNGDGFVDFFDFNDFVTAFETGC